jgi:hypothetical protein
MINVWITGKSQEPSKYIATSYIHPFLSMILPFFCSEDLRVTLCNWIHWLKKDASPMAEVWTYSIFVLHFTCVTMVEPLSHLLEYHWCTDVLKLWWRHTSWLMLLKVLVLFCTVEFCWLPSVIGTELTGWFTRCYTCIICRSCVHCLAEWHNCICCSLPP